jgi:hypothetical protein
MNSGAFGYIIGKKKRFMLVENDTELLWQILVREIYILMKQFGSIELIKKAFEQIKVVKNKPTKNNIENCRIFSDCDFLQYNNKNEDWSLLLKNCQNSYINLLESRYILNHSDDVVGRIFVLDFNKANVKYYFQDKSKNIIKELGTATIEEIMGFDDMPKKTYMEIVSEMKSKFELYYDNLKKIHEELDKLMKLKKKAKDENALNIEDKVDKLIDDMIWEEKQLHLGRRMFYHRLKAIDLIDEATF